MQNILRSVWVVPGVVLHPQHLPKMMMEVQLEQIKANILQKQEKVQIVIILIVNQVPYVTLLKKVKWAPYALYVLSKLKSLPLIHR